MAEMTSAQWEAQAITTIRGCDRHAPFPTSYCTKCREMFDAANPNYVRPYPDEIA